ncbi:MAG: hypothetical protein ABW173_11335 [Sphingomonas sp.]
MRNSARAGIGLAAACAASLAGAAPPAAAPVMIGGDELTDACATLAMPAGLKPGGDNFLSLRAGPGAAYRETARLTGADRLLVCGARGGWSAVVVRAAGRDCGVSSPRPTRGAYRGPCRSGWVASRFLHILAG